MVLVIFRCPEYAAQQNVPFSLVDLRLDKKYRFTDRRGGNFVLPQAYYFFKGRPLPGIYTYSFSLNASLPTLSGNM